MLMLEHGFSNFEFSDTMLRLFKADHPPNEPSITSGMARSYFERLRRLFALHTDNDDLLRDFIARENEHLARSVAVYGKLTVLPVLTTDYPTLALLLAALRINIWSDIDPVNEL